MSRIYFHSPSITTEVRGSERAWMGMLCNNLFESAARLRDSEIQSRPSPYRAILKPDHYAANSPNFTEVLRLAMTVGSDDPLVIEGNRVNCFAVALNTALDMGNDAIKLCARLHGQCEIHAWVDGPNRNWLADIIEYGRKRSIFRDEMGWEGVVGVLRSRDDEPVVTSYSVCDQFPNSGIAGWQPPIVDNEPDWDAWHSLSDDEQWRLAMEGLRNDRLMEMKPDNWESYYIGDGMNGFELYAAACNASQQQAA